LDYDLSTTNWVRIEDYRINASIRARACDLYFAATRCEFPLEQLSYKVLKVFPIYCSEIGTFL
jgi:hypothetical protein